MFSILKTKLYKWLDDLATVKLDEHSSLQRFSRDSYRYIEGDHQMGVQAELQPDNSVIVYQSTFNKWLPPFAEEIVTDEEKKKIRS